MNGTKQQLKLCDFGISERTGFLPPEPPLRRLPGEYFSSWEDTCTRIPHLIKDQLLRAEVDALPEREFNKDTLKTEQEWQRAYVLLTFLSQAYIWAEGEAGVIDKLPKKLAFPWCTVSKLVSLKPSITYAVNVLYNYGLCDSNSVTVLTDDNLKASSTFTGTEDESWFYMVHCLVELAAIPALHAIEHSYKAMEAKDNEQLVRDMENISESLFKMRSALKQIYEKCDPLTFYLKVRPFQSGSNGIKAFPNGIVFDGVDTEPKAYHGSSAGQGALIATFDVFLRAKHTGTEQEFLQTMREYMPRKHREFLETLEHLPSVRNYILQSNNPELIKNYNLAVEAFTGFRNEHIILVTRYIVMQRRHSVNASLDLTGTGGTHFMKFLKQVRDNTIALMIL